ncbi:sensor histidine kinase [Pseudoblastomonas halimionae]|uniref:Signal transduction histidine kinase internal region domain-containing protein n=1 Tax=Alteriqipengyuania halimionae TaxID=1926630 RepID=A0A6I4U6I4_9SPHN|nr:histidine kinase [Alteriqipengyuania halimionae]MXP10041.1 hypothetical protein [Alteriqipengyuania halimionae]
MIVDDLPAEGKLVPAPDDAPGVRNRDTHLVLAIIVFCWLFYLMTRILIGIAHEASPLDRWMGRLAVVGFGIALSCAMYRVLLRCVTRSVPVNALIVVAGACIASVPFALFNTWLIDTFAAPLPNFAMSALIAWCASVHLFFAQAIAMVAVIYAVQLRDEEAHSRTMQKSLRKAELRALRYQLNPHFLFNALNSVSALIWAKRPSEADRMVSRLADYYETVLTADDRELVPLSREIETQFQYLEIERTRFAERLKVTTDCPDHLRGALVPNLIIQPLVENSIKHGVARSSTEVEIGISVSEEDGRLAIIVSDSGVQGDGQHSARSFGVGLRNTEARLHSFFGPTASLRVEARPDGFLSRIELPLKTG